MAPMAMAMPPSDMMLALIPCCCITAKAISTPTGKDTMATNEERRCQRKAAQTNATTMNSSTSFSPRLRTARSINWLRS
ncbi:hypothetical protein D3C84_1267720 [compost metagenome]